MKTAADLGIPEQFNASAYFVDRHVAEGRGARIAIECGDERVTYAALAERVNRCGNALRDECRVRPGERVVLLLLDGPAFFYAFFGAIKIGAVPIPVNTMWKTADYRYVLNDSGAGVAIVSDALLPAIDAIPRSDVPALRRIVVAGGAGTFDSLLAAGGSDLDPARTAHDAPAFWLYSSGSTGAPKGCVHRQHAMVVCAELFGKRILGIRESDRCFSAPKLFFAYGLGNAGYFPLAAGATSILWPGRPIAADVYKVIERHRPTLFFFVPTGYGMMLACRGLGVVIRAPRQKPTPALWRGFKERFGIDITTDRIDRVLHTFISIVPAPSSGIQRSTREGYEAALLGDDKRAVGVGESGSLFVRGASICDGYWNQPEKTRQTIDGGWIRTGDQYSRDADGFYWHAGRADDMLKVGGLWVSPVEVESAILEHGAVQECAVVGHEDADALVKPLAFVVLRAGTDATPALAAALQDFVRTRLADYKRPRWVRFTDALPRTATGKLQRFKLRENG
jgi:benzoate-CoA ligase